MFEVEVVDVNSLQLVHDDKLVDTAELGHQLTVEHRLHSGHQSV